MTTRKRDRKTGRFLPNPPAKKKKAKPKKAKPTRAQQRAKTRAATRAPGPKHKARRANAALPTFARNPGPVPQAKRDLLEADLVDRYGLGEVLEALGLICWEKADHLRTNWQDTYSARPWEEMGKRIDTQSQAARQKGL